MAVLDWLLDTYAGYNGDAAAVALYAASLCLLWLSYYGAFRLLYAWGVVRSDD